MGRGSRRARRRRWLLRDQVSFESEATYIRDCALRRETHVVALPPLVFFSTESGDAWMLDPGDGLARRLATDGTPLPHGIRETPETFGVEWEHEYELEGNAMVVHGHGKSRVIVGYPVAAIREAIRQVRRAT